MRCVRKVYTDFQNLYSNLWTAAYQGHATIADALLRRFEASHTREEKAQFLLQRPHPKSGHPILWAAATSGKPDVIEVLLWHGCLYEDNWFGATPLVGAVTFGCLAVVEFLINKEKIGQLDVRINQQTRNGQTALFKACELRQPLIAQVLLDAGADYRITEKDNTTPLQMACFNGMFRVVQAIIKRASAELDRDAFLAYLNTQHRPTGNVALMDCSERNRFACLNLLLENGADPTIPGHGNYTTLFVASRHNNSGVMTALVRKAADTLDRERFLSFINMRHSSGKTAIIDCAERGREEAVNVLLDHSADYRIAGGAGNSPLHWACIGGHSEVTKILLKKAKSDHSGSLPFEHYINAQNHQGFTPLMHAASNNFETVVKVLISYGVDYGLSRTGGGLQGVTALHDACYKGAAEVAKLLIETASQEMDHDRFVKFLNARNEKGHTPFRDACEKGRARIVGFMVRLGHTDYMMPNETGVTPLHVCFLPNFE